MNWQIVLLLNIIFNVAAQILIKLIVDKFPWRTQALFLQYLITTLIMSFYALYAGQFHFSGEALKVISLGFLVAFGAYCQWRAIAISLSKTSLFLPLFGVLTVILASIFLGETREWSLGLTAGIILCFLAAFFFHGKPKRERGTQNDNGKWLFYASGMILIFGTTNFLMKVFSSDIPRGQFLFYWYLGAFLGSFLLLYLERQTPLKWPGRMIFLVPLSSLAIIGNLATQYWAFQLTLASRVMPLQMVGVTFLPVLAGWLLFKERKELSRKNIMTFLLGIAGALLIILS